MVDMKDPDRLETGNFQYWLGRMQEDDFMVGNTVYYRMDVTDTIKLAAPAPRQPVCGSQQGPVEPGDAEAVDLRV